LLKEGWLIRILNASQSVGRDVQALTGKMVEKAVDKALVLPSCDGSEKKNEIEEDDRHHGGKSEGKRAE
jgi:hypothetical protein